MADPQELQVISPRLNEPCTPTVTPGSAVPGENTPTPLAMQQERPTTPVRQTVGPFIDASVSPGTADPGETTSAPLVMQQERPRTPVRPPVDPFIDANISPVSSLSSALTELDGDIVREGSPCPSRSPITQTSSQIVDLTALQVDYTVSEQTGLGEILREDSPVRTPSRVNWASNHVVDLTAPEVNYTVSPQTGLATVVHDRSPTRARHFRINWSNDRNRIVCELIQGLDRVFPTSVREKITQWHDLHPETKPPCAYTQSKRLAPSYKVFDRDGGEHDVSEIKVVVQPHQSDPQSSPKRRLHYKTMILHSEDGPEELVAVINSSKPHRAKVIQSVDPSTAVDTFLVIWLGPEEVFEPEPCAVVVEYVNSSRVKFRPDWFDDTPRTLPGTVSSGKTSSKKRPASRSPPIQPPQNAGFSPELMGTPASPGRTPSSSPSKTPRTPNHGRSRVRADSNELFQSLRRSRILGLSPIDSRDTNRAVTSPDKQRPISQLLVCRLVCYKVNCSAGTHGTLSLHIREVLRQWHDGYPLDPPPCAVEVPLTPALFRLGTSNWVLDRNGARCEVFWFELVEQDISPIRRRRRYQVLVLHQARGPDVLVCPRERALPGNNQTSLVFLYPWLGLHMPTDVQACAVKINDGSGSLTRFSPEIFGLAPKHPPEEHHGTSGVGQGLTVLQVHDKEDGNRRASSMLPPDLPISLGRASCEPAQSHSRNISMGACLHDTAVQAAISPSSDDLQALTGQAQSYPGRRIQSARRLFGRDRPLQSYIRNQIEEWHSVHDSALPDHLLIAEQNLSTLLTCSVFDRKGVQREFSVFSIFVSSDVNCDQYLLEVPSDNFVSYSVVILHTETEGDKLVALAPTTTWKEGERIQFLLAWNGLTKQFETEVCAVTVYRDTQNGKGPTFSPDLFNEAGSWPSSWVAAMNQSLADEKMTRAGNMNETSQEVERYTALNQWARAEPEIQGPPSRSSGSMSPPKIPRTEAKKEPSFESSSADSIRQPPLINPGLRAKFVSGTSDRVRIFSMAGCDVETIFRKAREFYKDRDPTREFVLAWKIPGMEGERYVWEGCQDEYDLLCEDLQRLTIGDGVVHEIETKLADLEAKSPVPRDNQKRILQVKTKAAALWGTDNAELFFNHVDSRCMADRVSKLLTRGIAYEAVQLAINNAIIARLRRTGPGNRRINGVILGDVNSALEEQCAKELDRRELQDLGLQIGIDGFLCSTEKGDDRS